MELRHIRYFARAAEFLHFTRAAESLGVSQPALSLHIQQLEREVGSPLFDRTGSHVRHVRLTEAGKRLLIHAHEILRAVEKGKQEIADLRGLLCGNVILGVNNIFVPKLMTECLPAYSVAHPGINTVVKMENNEGLEAAILAGEMDLALAWLPPDSKEIESEVLFTDELILAVSPKHALAKRDQVFLHELSDMPLALPTVATSMRRLVNTECAKKKLTLRTALEIDDTPARLTFVTSGIAATLTPRRAVDDRTGSRMIPIADAQFTLSAGLLTQRGVHLSSAAQRLADMVRSHFKA